MKTASFGYTLPPELIASEPLPRGESRLLEVPAVGAFQHRGVADLPRLLEPGDVLVVNNTRVIPARLFAHKESGGRVEILLTKKLGETAWRTLARPAKRLRAGTRLHFEGGLTARVEERESSGQIRLSFSEPVEPRLAAIGHVPLPPYIQRPDNDEDRERYQTVFARHAGAIAAPTAGLHFSRALVDQIEAAGIERIEITLHVGLGTFLPVTAEEVEDHRMESESYSISEQAVLKIAEARSRGNRVIAVGTTVVRALESAARDSHSLRAGAGSTELFILPGFEFRVVDALLTNFHLPQSTLLMLVSAFAGSERIREAYDEAIRSNYRFYSYGDAMLLQRSR